MATKKEKAEEKIVTLADITRFITDAGSDDLNTFGGDHVGGACVQQVPDELAPCILKLLEMGVKIDSYLEVGAAAGGSAYIFNHYFMPGNIVLIDNNSHPNCVKRPEVLEGIAYREIIGDVHDPDVIRQAEDLGPYDFIILDCDHSYDSTMADVLLYGPLLSPGGFLFFHDSVWRGGKVDWVVRGLKQDPGWEFIGEWISPTHYSNPCGIAVFRKAVNE
jgi:cephalosporin hydroxylase